ncbi:unnamed protein product, partial [Rotaria sp. Silwood1]
MTKDSKKSTNDLNQVSSSLATTSFTSTPKAKRRKLFNYDDSNMDDSNESTTLDPTVELNAYLNDPCFATGDIFQANKSFNLRIDLSSTVGDPRL